jgi:hypothetical protein
MVVNVKSCKPFQQFQDQDVVKGMKLKVPTGKRFHNNIQNQHNALFSD